jgi:NADH:ubiquinone oxidoreductase subunit 5 (subunit L)/multisubunit Na+/H+ antiporter MnhA subunit
MNETAITIIGILLLTGAMAKSAQIPLHSWLPGSMEGLNGVKPHIIIFYKLRI